MKTIKLVKVRKHSGHRQYFHVYLAYAVTSTTPETTSESFVGVVYPGDIYRFRPKNGTTTPTERILSLKQMKNFLTKEYCDGY